MERFLECGVDIPVDGANLDPDAVSVLNRLQAAVWYTEFGWHEARSAGFEGTRHVVPHGISFEPPENDAGDAWLNVEVLAGHLRALRG